jgi:limonene-1,2-epoxide hydrolase
MTDFRALFDEVIRAWHRHDIDAVLAHLSDDVVWHYHVGSRPARGKAAARKMLTLLAQRQLDIGWKIFHHAVAGNRLFVEGADVYRTPSGVAITMPYMGILEFRDGLICAWRDYVDASIVAKLEAGEAPADYLVELGARSAG